MLTTFFYQKGKPFETNISRQRMFEILQQKEGLLWVDLENPNEFESDMLVEIFNFHDLAVEDCISDISSPKADDYEEYLFLVMHSLSVTEKGELRIVELDIFLGGNYVVTFHKDAVRGIQQVRDAIQKNHELVLGLGSDLLVHKILDYLVDNYLPVLDHYDRRIDMLEESIVDNPPHDYLSTVMQLKRHIFSLRRTVSPQRDTIYYLTRNPMVFIKPKHLAYFRDVYDHLFRIYETAEGYHEHLTSLLQVYFSYQSHKLNNIMKRMTVLATLTMPTVMIASIYGMNFKFMPELVWEHGYFLSLGLMMSISIGMLLWMKFKKWI
jgi:magnesium transporter